jgi:hypothetical protein
VTTHQPSDPASVFGYPDQSIDQDAEPNRVPDADDALSRRRIVKMNRKSVPHRIFLRTLQELFMLAEKNVSR